MISQENQNRKTLLGSGRAVVVTFSRQILNGTLLVASDGLLKYAEAASICGNLSEHDLEKNARQLVNLVRLKSGKLQDDVSTIPCRQL
jgi:serine/threonine protein phosphatase PrpC